MRRLEGLFKQGVPAWLQADFGHPRYQRYLIYPEKLANETWDMLDRLDLARMDSEDRDYEVPPALGLLLMSLLADACAGTTRTKVTDRERAYAWLMGLMTEDLGGQYLPNLDASHLASTYDRLVTIALRTVDTSDITVEMLVALRKREAEGSGGDLRTLRVRYLETTAQFVQRLAAPGVTSADQEEIARQYHLAMEADLTELKKELRIAARKALLSKEVLVCVLALAGSVLVPLTAPAVAAAALKSVGVGALINTGLEYRTARHQALSTHAMSWLYVAT